MHVHARMCTDICAYTRTMHGMQGEAVDAAALDISITDLESCIGYPLPAFEVDVRQVSARYGPGAASRLTITP